MDEVYTYLAPLPNGIKEIVVPCVDGYTVYIDAALDREARKRAYKHAIKHVRENDFSKEDVQEIEELTHKGKP